MATTNNDYPVRFDVDYPAKLDRATTFFRLLWSIPILVVMSALSSSGYETVVHHSGGATTTTGGSITAGLATATALMILFRRRYPRWWFDFAVELNRFSARVGAYIFLLTDRYPSTVEQQTVHLDYVYPDVERDLNRWLPLVKWLLALPHYVVLALLVLGAFITTIIAWFAILFTGQYPKGLFDFVVGVGRWGARVNAYAFLLTTDKYPPFSLS
ncbi:MAG TPA: DUF4389 domain-containing protein [Candidatus Saccharimonadales bacterium]|nr:DUF4389 domain-containing protein [Candidatus Saccharimonadales bacterium]